MIKISTRDQDYRIYQEKKEPFQTKLKRTEKKGNDEIKNRNLKELKKVNKEYTDTSAKLEIALSYIVPILEDFEKKLIELEKKDK